MLKIYMALDTDNPIENLTISILKDSVEASRSPLIITDNRLPDNPIIYSNKAFEEMTGYSMTDIIGKNCRFLQGEDTKKADIAKLHTAVHTNTYVRTLLKNYRKDGTPFWNDLVVSPVTDTNGATTHFIGMQLDVTDRITDAERLTAKSQELQRSNAELEQFAYAASHDLQEPLRMISSYLQLLDRRYGKDFDADAKTFIGFASEGAERMQALIDDLLKLSRITTTSEPHRPVPMAKVIERALFNLKIRLDESQAVVEISEMPILSVDSMQMTQLFQNLISNALKYSHPGVVPHITINAARRKNSWEFTVADNGIGIDKRHFTRIFQVFQRLHTRAEFTGTGVGLAICSKIVDRHHGKIWVESKTGKGSAFIFTLPLKEG